MQSTAKLWIFVYQESSLYLSRNNLIFQHKVDFSLKTVSYSHRNYT